MQQLYIFIFVYVGINFARRTFFGKTPSIWNTTIPEPDNLLVILDAIEYARLEGDLVRYACFNPVRSCFSSL
jgi:hypothetical protein